MSTPLATPTYSIGAMTFQATDVNGVVWVVASTNGWFEGPPVRLNQVAMPRYDGVFTAPSFRGSRVITLTGWVKAPSKQAVQSARDALTGLFAGGSRQTLTVADDFQTRTALVELADVPKASPAANGLEFDWQLVLSAADPRKYDPNTITQTTSVPSSTSGLDWSTGGGLDWSTGGGLNWGTATSNGTLTLTNAGTADTWPTFTLAGALTNPTITNTATGQQLVYNGSTGSSDQLVVSPSPYSRYVSLNGSTDRRPSVSPAQWFAIPPASSVTVSLNSTNVADTGTLTASINPAYW